MGGREGESGEGGGGWVGGGWVGDGEGGSGEGGGGWVGGGEGGGGWVGGGWVGVGEGGGGWVGGGWVGVGEGGGGWVGGGWVVGGWVGGGEGGWLGRREEVSGRRVSSHTLCFFSTVPAFSPVFEHRRNPSLEPASVWREATCESFNDSEQGHTKAGDISIPVNWILSKTCLIAENTVSRI